MSNSNALRTHTGAWVAERISALLAAVVCMGVTFFVWSAIASQQPMWAFPALYLIEMLALCALVVVASARGIAASALLAWMATGAVLAFSVLAMFSVGLYFVPVTVLLALVGIFAAWRTRTSALTCAALAVLAALAQTGIVYIVSLLLRG